MLAIGGLSDPYQDAGNELTISIVIMNLSHVLPLLAAILSSTVASDFRFLDGEKTSRH